LSVSLSQKLFTTPLSLPLAAFCALADVIMQKTFSCQIISTQIDFYLVLDLSFFPFVEFSFVDFHNLSFSPTSKELIQFRRNLEKVQLFVGNFQISPHLPNKSMNDFINDLTGGWVESTETFPLYSSLAFAPEPVL
jgi:hypothetical protein